MLKINFLMKKTIILLFFMMFISHIAIGMFTVPRRKPVIRKASTYSALKPVLEEEKEKAKTANLLEAKETAANLLMAKEIEAGYLKKFYIYNKETQEGVFVDKDTLFLSETMRNLLGDIVDETTEPIAPSERLIPLDEKYSGETIKKAFDLLKKYREKQSILDDVASFDLKSFTELVNFCDYIDLSGTDMNMILANELLNRIKKVSLSPSQSDVQQLESIHPDFVKIFVFPKAVWDINIIAVKKSNTEIYRTFPIYFDINSFSIWDKGIHDDVRYDRDWDYYTWIFTYQNQWFLQYFYVPNKRAVYNIWKGLDIRPLIFANVANNGGEVMQLQCNWDKKRAVVAIKGNGNNGIVLDFNNLNNLFGFVLPECPQDINSIAISHDGNFIAAAFDGKENNIVIWDINGGKDNIIIQKETRDNPVSSIMFSKNTTGSDTLMYCSEKTIYSKNMTTNQWKESASFDSPIQRAEMSPNGQSIAVLFDSSIILINTKDGKNIYKTEKDELDYSVIFSSDSTYLQKFTRNRRDPDYRTGDAKWINNTFFRGSGYNIERHGNSTGLIIVTPSDWAKRLLPQDLTISRLIHIYNGFEKGIASKAFDYFKYRVGQAVEAFKGYFDVLK